MSQIEPLSAVDAAWLRMEDPTNLMMVSGLLSFETPVDIDRLRQLIRQRLLQFDRFRMRVVMPKLPFLPIYWQEDPHFDLNAHIHHVALPEPGDYATLQNMVSDLMSTPLDFSKPLWMVHVIDNYEGGTAVFVRLHHCIADGMALVFVLLSLTDLSPETAQNGVDIEEESVADGNGTLRAGMLKALVKRTSNMLGMARNLTGRAFVGGLSALEEPSRLAEWVQWGGDNALAATRLFLRSNDADSLFKGKLGTQKRAAWSRPLPLKQIKAIRNVMGGTVNDVLVSAMTGGLRRYLESRGQDVSGLSFRAGVPINLRKPSEMGSLGNKFGLLFLDLPVGIADPVERLQEVHKRMEELKKSKEGPMGLLIIGGMGITPQELQGTLVEMFGKKLTAVMTNVPGPPMPLYMAGSRISGLMFWVPQSGRLGLGISIISYAGKVHVGVATDAGLVPNPDQIIDGFYHAFDEMLQLVAEAEAADVAPTAVAETTVAPTAVETDGIHRDLQAIKGIGATYEARLRAAQIHSVEELLATPATAVADILGCTARRATTFLAEAEKLLANEGAV